MYNIPNNRYLAKSIPLLGNWFKAHWMRAGSGTAHHVRRRAGDR